MTLATALLVALQAAPATMVVPADWSGLPALRYLHPAQPAIDLSSFVRAEVAAGRCAHAAATTAGGWTLTVDMAVLATPQATIRRIVPRAIDCASVEQYAAGILSSMARGNIDVDGAAVDGWYRTSLTFSWRS